MKTRAFHYGCVTLLLLTGCAIVSPRLPEPWEDSRYTLQQYEYDRAGYYDRGNSKDERRAYRDQIIFRMLREIDANYARFTDALYADRATAQTLGEVAQIGLGTAGSLMGTASIKSILAATAAGIAGTDASIKKNFFAEQGTGLLLSRMNAVRAKRLAVIEKKVAADINDYSLEEAERDLTQYYQAGTLKSAMEDITAESGKKRDDAEQAVSEAITKRFGELLTPTDTGAQKELLDRYHWLKTKQAADDPEVRRKALAVLKAYDSFQGTEDAAVAALLERIYAAGSENKAKLLRLMKENQMNPPEAQKP